MAIVSKKQLEESGFDNLRDYLNAERGLTRRDGKVAVRKGEMDIKSPAERRSVTRMADVAARKPSAERRSDTRLRDSQSAAASSANANMMLVDSAPLKISEDLIDSKKRGGAVKKMAAGGSASKRADGICVKGKTKGKFV